MTELKLSSGTVKKANPFLVKLRLVAAGNDEASFSFSLKFDPKVLQLVGEPKLVSLEKLPEGTNFNYNYKNVNYGITSYLVDTTNSFNKGTHDIFTLTFQPVKGIKTGTKTKIEFADTPTLKSISNTVGALLPAKYTAGVITLK
jgi:Cohesin domain